MVKTPILEGIFIFFEIQNAYAFLVVFHRAELKFTVSRPETALLACFTRIEYPAVLKMSQNNPSGQF